MTNKYNTRHLQGAQCLSAGRIKGADSHWWHYSRVNKKLIYRGKTTRFSATHFFLGWLRDHAIHWTLQLLYNYIQTSQSCIDTISKESVWHSTPTLPMKVSNIIYQKTSFKVICLCVIRKPLRAVIKRRHILRQLINAAAIVKNYEA